MKEEGTSEITSSGPNDVLTKALGTDEQRGRVRGMGRFVTPKSYFYLPKNVKHYMDSEMKKNAQRINTLVDDVEILKKAMNIASEAGSCQMWEHDDCADDVVEEAVRNYYFLNSFYIL